MAKKVAITLGNVRSRIFGLTYKDYQIIRKACGWRQEGFFFSEKYKVSGWDGYNSLLTKKGFFPSGIIEIILNKLCELSIEYKVFDKRSKFNIDTDKVLKRIKSFGKVLRDYQIDGIITGFKNRFMLFEWPTASGKAILFSGLVQGYNLKTLIIVNRKELMYQLSDVLKETTTLGIGIIGDGHWEPDRVTVASVDTLMSRLDEDKTKQFLSSIRYFIADESHHLGATGWKKVAFACVNAVVRHGFSGTCFRTDSKDILLIAATGPIKHKITASELIKRGYLSKPNISLCYVNNMEYDENYWPNIENNLIVNNDKRNLIAMKYIIHHYEKNRQILVIVRRPKHAKLVADNLIQKFKLPYCDVRYATGTKDTNFRKKVLDDFRNKRLSILIGTSIYNEGVDLPNADVGVNLAGGDSAISTIQKLGRILRKTKGEYDFDIDPDKPQLVYYLDFIDLGNKYSASHSYHREEIYKMEEEFHVERIDGKGVEWFPQSILKN